MSRAVQSVPAYKIVRRDGPPRYVCGHCAATNGDPTKVLDQRSYLWIETVYSMSILRQERCDCGRRAIPFLR